MKKAAKIEGELSVSESRTKAKLVSDSVKPSSSS